MSHTPEQVIRYALSEALDALDRSDWEDLAGQLDVAQGWIERAQAYEAEHTVNGGGGVAALVVAVGDVWRVKEDQRLVVVVPSVEGIVTREFGAPSEVPETHWTPHDFLRKCQRVSEGERL